MGATVRGDGGGDDDEAEEAVVAEINITPLTDIFLVLLIIFMVTSSAMVEQEVQSRSGVKVTLPKANATGPVEQKRSDPIVTVTKDGTIYIGTKKVEVMENLEAELKQALEAAGSQTVLVRGDQNVQLGKAVDLMAVAKRAGATHIGILTSKGSP